MEKQNNSKKESTKISISITKHGNYDTAAFNTQKSTIHTLNLPQGDEYIGTVLNIDNNSDKGIINIVGNVAYLKDKKVVKGILLYTGGHIQLVCVPSSKSKNKACIWKPIEPTTTIFTSPYIVFIKSHTL